MKTLVESLFDTDVKGADVKVGEMAVLSEVSHYNMVSNDLSKVLGMFDLKKLSKEKFPIRVPRDHGFIEYWNKEVGNDGVGLIVDLILNMPVQTLLNPHAGCKLIKDYFKPYLTKKAEKIYISDSGVKNLYTVDIYDDIFLNSPSRIELTFEFQK